MSARALFFSLLVARLLCFPAGASQPEGLVAKLIANPPVTPATDPGGGLPPVACTGFSLAEPFTNVQPDSTVTITLEMAIILFRSGFTAVDLPDLMHLRFADGMVNGLPYRRFGWNDIRVVVRPATQDYMLTLNGKQAGPFPNEFPCAPAGDCLTLQGLSIRGGVFEEAVAWIDNLSVVYESSAGQEILIDWSFDQCYASQHVSLGGLLIVDPPLKLGSGGTR